MSARRRLSIRSALILMAAVVLLPLLAMVGFVIYRGAQHAEAQAYAAVLDAAHSRAQAIELKVEDMRESLEAIAQRPLVRALDPSLCDPLLQELRSIDSRVANIGLRTRAGESMCLQHTQGALSAAEIRDVEWFREAIAAEGFRVSDAFLAKTLGRWVVAFSQTVRDASGAPAAVLTAAMPAERSGGWAPRGKPLEGAVVILVDRAGRVIFRSLDNRAWFGKKAAGTALLEEASSQAEGTFRAKGLDGVERIYGFATVPSAGWKVLVGVPAALVSDGLQRQLRYSVVLWGALALVACMLALVIAQSIGGPIHRLRGLVRAAGEGYSRFTIQASGPAEVAELAEEFNYMLSARQVAEDGLKHALLELTRQQGELQAMTRRLITLQEKERRDIARELHDRVGQNLSSLSINLERLRADSAGHESSARIAECAAIVESTGVLIQDVLTELKPPMLANYGLLDAVRWHAREFSRRTGIAVEVINPDAAPRLSPEIEMALFRIVQAALNNVAHHARAKSVQVSLERNDGKIAFHIRDDGAGFDTAQAMASGRWGLTGMRERAEAIGGTLRMESSPGRGTRIVVEAEIA